MKSRYNCPFALKFDFDLNFLLQTPKLGACIIILSMIWLQSGQKGEEDLNPVNKQILALYMQSSKLL